jgi:hypothetical protein
MVQQEAVLEPMVGRFVNRPGHDDKMNHNAWPNVPDEVSCIRGTVLEHDSARKGRNLKSKSKSFNLPALDFFGGNECAGLDRGTGAGTWDR